MTIKEYEVTYIDTSEELLKPHHKKEFKKTKYRVGILVHATNEDIIKITYSHKDDIEIKFIKDVPPTHFDGLTDETYFRYIKSNRKILK